MHYMTWQKAVENLWKEMVKRYPMDPKLRDTVVEKLYVHEREVIRRAHLSDSSHKKVGNWVVESTFTKQPDDEKNPAVLIAPIEYLQFLSGVVQTLLITHSTGDDGLMDSCREALANVKAELLRSAKISGE